jgi:hypothetical protein
MLTPTGLTRLVLPDLFGNEYSSGYVGDSVATQIPLYIGIVPLILALAALFLAPRHTRLLGALALVAIVYALGNRTPVAPVLEALLPPLAAFRIPSRMLVIGALPLSVLAGLGFDALSRATASRCSTRLACVAVAGVVALATTGLLGLAAGVPFVKELWLVAIEGPQSHAPSEQVDAAWRVARAAAIPTTIVLLAGVGTLVALFRSGPTRRWPAVAVLALTFCDVTLHARPWVRELSPSVASMDDLVLGIVSAVRQDAETGLGARVLSQVPNRVQPVPISFLDSYGIGDTLGEVVPNWLAARGLRSVTGEIGLIPARTMLFTGNVGRYQIAAVEPQARLGMLGVSWIVGRHEPGSEVDERTSDRSPSALTLMRSPGALPIAVLARRVRVMAGVDQVREALDRTPGGGDPRDEVLVESPVAGHEADERDSADSPGVAKVTRIDTNRMVVEVDATRRAWLVMLDTYDPRWGATIDGHPAPVRPAHLMFRAVEVPSGHHLVAMRYVPVPFRIGVAIAALVAVPVVLMTLLVTRRTR